MIANSHKENQKRMERLRNIWASFADRELIIAIRSVNVFDIQWDERILTAAVGITKNMSKPMFKFNPHFFDAISDDDVAFVIAHETSHLLLKHLFLLKETKHYQENDIAYAHAVDAIINDWLLDAGYPEGPWIYGKRLFCTKCNGAGCATDPLCKGEDCVKCGGTGQCKTTKCCTGINSSGKSLYEIFYRTMNLFKNTNQRTSSTQCSECLKSEQKRDSKQGQQGQEKQEGQGGQGEQGEQEKQEGQGGGGGCSQDCKHTCHGHSSGANSSNGQMVDDHSQWANDNEALDKWLKENNVDKDFAEQLKEKFKNLSAEEEKQKEKDFQKSIEDDDERTSDTDAYIEKYSNVDGSNANEQKNFSMAPGHIVGEGAIFDVDKLSKVRANWRAILAEGLSLKERVLFTWRRNPTVLMASSEDYRLPFEDAEPVLRVLVALDVSGSVSEGDKRLFINCWRGIPRGMFDVRGIVFADRAAEIKLTRDSSEKRFQHDHVGGGTDFCAITDWMKKNKYEPDKVVVITDAGSTWRYRVKNPNKYFFVIRNIHYETSDGGIDYKRIINDWQNYHSDKTAWEQAKFFSFTKFAKVLSTTT